MKKLTPQQKINALVKALRDASYQLDLDSGAFSDRDDTLEATNSADAAFRANEVLKKVTGKYR